MLTKTVPNNKTYGSIIILGLCLSLFISWISILNNDVLSPDSLLYIFTAMTYIDNGMSAAIDVYKWPWLSIIVAEIHNLTGLSLVNSGYCLIASFYAGITWGFISLVKDMGGNTRSLLIALVIISFFPTLNDYRDYISRDAGFWLFTLLSLQQLIRYSRNTNIKHAISWFVFTLTAIMFRTEALFFTVFAPLALLFDSQLSTKLKLQKTVILYSLLLGTLIAGLIFVSTSPALTGKLRLFTEIANINAFIGGLTNSFNSSIELISEAKPYEPFVEDINTIFILGLSGLTLYTVLHALTLPHLAIICWPTKGGESPRNQSSLYAIAYLLIVISYLLIKTFHGFFTTDRYCLTAALIIMLAIPLKIQIIWNNISVNQSFVWRKTLLALLLLYPILDSLINTKSDKEYIAQATEWVAQHKLPEQRLLTNNQQIAVLGANCRTSCFFDNESKLINWNELKHYDQLAIRIKEKQKPLLEKVTTLLNSGDWLISKSFNNSESDKVLILSRQSKVAEISP